MAPFRTAEWTISSKIVKDLADSPFDGNIVNYRDWHDLMRDQRLSANQGYGRILYELEQQVEPLYMNTILANPYPIRGFNCDIAWITKHLWTFIARNVIKSFRKSLKSLVAGEEFNGLELWRTLWISNEGGFEQVECVDLGALHTFPVCESPADVQRFLGEWLALAQEQSTDPPGKAFDHIAD